MLEFEILTPEQLPQIYEWEAVYFSEQQPFVEWFGKLTQPRWTHYGIVSQGELLACLSVEAWSATVWEAHVSARRGAIPSQQLAHAARLLIQGAFKSGIERIFALIPNDMNAPQRFAEACGMQRGEQVANYITYEIESFPYGERRQQNTTTSLSKHEYLPMDAAT